MASQTAQSNVPPAEKRCSFCREPIEEEPVSKGGRLFCCRACAFEASRCRPCDPDRIVYRG